MAGAAGAAQRRGGILPFHAITPFTMLDYPGQVAAILWVAGCTMRCGYCHNPAIVTGRGRVSEDEALAFLTRRRGKLDGVVLSGGEATSWRGIAGFAARAKALDYLVKLDTNGLRPDVVRQLADARLIDAVALDFKAPRSRFRAVTASTAWRRFVTTLDWLCAQTGIACEVRTTVHSDLIDEDDVLAMAAMLAERGYRGRYWIQQAIAGDDRPTLGALRQGRPIDREHLMAHSPVPIGFR